MPGRGDRRSVSWSGRIRKAIQESIWSPTALPGPGPVLAGDSSERGIRSIEACPRRVRPTRLPSGRERKDRLGSARTSGNPFRNCPGFFLSSRSWPAGRPAAPPWPAPKERCTTRRCATARAGPAARRQQPISASAPDCGLHVDPAARSRQPCPRSSSSSSYLSLSAGTGCPRTRTPRPASPKASHLYSYHLYLFSVLPEHPRPAAARRSRWRRHPRVEIPQEADEDSRKAPGPGFNRT